MLEHPPPNDKPMIEGQGISSGPYQATQDGIFWLRDGPPGIRLTNFTAQITKDIKEDDGVEEHRFFTIRAKLLGKEIPPFTIPASKFASMSWVPEHLV